MSSTRNWLPEESIRMPSVSGRVDSAAEDSPAHFFLHVEYPQLAAGGIDQDAKRKRQVRFGGEVFDGLRLAVLENRKVVFGQAGNQRAVLVFDIVKNSDHVDADFEGLNRRLVFGFLRV